MSLISCLFASLSLLAQQTVTEDIAVLGGRIEIGDGQVIEQGTVLIHSGHILSLGSNISVPPEFRVVNVKSCTVYPGFIDAYSSRGMTFPPQVIESVRPQFGQVYPEMDRGNRKGVRPELSAAAQGQLPNEITDEYLRAGFVAAMLIPEAGILGGQGGVVDFGPGPWQDRVMAPRVGCAFGYGGAAFEQKVPAYPSTLLGAIAQFRQAMVDASQSHGYDPALDSLERVLASKTPLIMPVRGRAEAQHCRMLVEEFHIVPVFLVRGNVEPEDVRGFDVIVGADAGKEELVKLAEGGVSYSLASTQGTSVDETLKLIREAIKAGLPREFALRALTSRPAHLFGIDGFGTLKAGGVADLTILTGDFADSSSKVKSVIVRGNQEIR